MAGLDISDCQQKFFKWVLLFPLLFSKCKSPASGFAGIVLIIIDSYEERKANRSCVILFCVDGLSSENHSLTAEHF